MSGSGLRCILSLMWVWTGDFDDNESPTKTSSSGRPPTEELQPLGAREAMQPGASGRVFSRSQTQGAERMYGSVNGTFLTECSFGVAHDRLVQVITDVHPFEPRWEHLSTMDLSEKNLESVARLKEFLPGLDSLSLWVWLSFLWIGC